MTAQTAEPAPVASLDPLDEPTAEEIDLLAAGVVAVLRHELAEARQAATMASLPINPVIDEIEPFVKIA